MQIFCWTMLLGVLVWDAAAFVPMNRPLLGRGGPEAATRAGGLGAQAHVRLQRFPHVLGLRMTGRGDGDDDERLSDPVWRRVNQRMGSEPIQLVMAYCEHAYHAPSAERPSDRLEAAFSALAEPPAPADAPGPVPPVPPQAEISAPPPVSLESMAPTEDMSLAGPIPETMSEAAADKVPTSKGEEVETVVEAADKAEGDATMPTTHDWEDASSVLKRARAAEMGTPVGSSSAVPFDRHDARDREDAASVLERAHAMGQQAGDIVSNPEKTKRWSREHTIDTACAWEKHIVAEGIIHKLTNEDTEPPNVV